MHPVQVRARPRREADCANGSHRDGPRHRAPGRRSPGEEEFEALAKAYARWAPGASPRTPLKFAVVDLENNQQAFGVHQLRSVPVVAYMPPKKSGSVTLKQRNKMDLGEGELTAATIGAWVSRKTGQRVRGGPAHVLRSATPRPHHARGPPD